MADCLFGTWNIVESSSVDWSEESLVVGSDGWGADDCRRDFEVDFTVIEVNLVGHAVGLSHCSWSAGVVEHEVVGQTSETCCGDLLFAVGDSFERSASRPFRKHRCESFETSLGEDSVVEFEFVIMERKHT